MKRAFCSANKRPMRLHLAGTLDESAKIKNHQP